MDDVEGRRFTNIVDVSLVRDTDNMDSRVPQRLAMIVQSVLNFVHHEMWHLAVDVTSKFNKTRLNSSLFRFPGQIKRIDRDTMAPESRPRIERHESERL